jgi:hypothetical protein
MLSYKTIQSSQSPLIECQLITITETESHILSLGSYDQKQKKPRNSSPIHQTLNFQNKELDRIEANSLQFSEIRVRIFIIELEELQSKHKFKRIVRSQFREVRRREIEAESHQ